ncbi:putative outer membrane protein [Bacteroides coprosuis DSM 18011]|uniref:Putative outer membrane protein n=1 Tax=Bacteroides coprosuis DSM 18011 TaxID=679937 RepID=F3ZNM5_9BACE|nr:MULTISPECIES: outer membrane beta-barrel protein [Bacteroides]EGJ72560.1 putative outer membrane protein [Bacteroides coprosuis DSM 18011]HJD91171.1 hypothetical protein [Bacteroides coprosuis]
MGRINKIVCAVIVTLFSGVALAQNNTNSPYTRYGLGQLTDLGSSKSKAMGGVGFALRDNSQINLLNPASYTAMDSLTFLFEGGVSFQNANIDDGSTKLNAKNSSLDYLAVQFRLKKWMAMSVGLLPFSNVGYQIVEGRVNEDDPEANVAFTHKGNGGLHQFYTGIGLNPIKGLSVGANVSFLWGSITHNISMYFPNASESDKRKAYNDKVSLKSAKIDFGAQYSYPIGKDDELTIGAVYTPKMSMSNDTETTTVFNHQVLKEGSSKFDLPSSFGLGVAYNWNKKLLVSLDLLHQKWSKAKYYDKTDAYLDYNRISVGAEYSPNIFARNYFARIKYRVGMYYADPYYKIEGKRAAREYGVSAGIGLPIPKVKSQLNVSAQYIRIDGRSDNFLKENYLRINVGLVFNERWFAKRKI